MSAQMLFSVIYRCRENCGSRIRFASVLLLSADCTEFCSNHYGSIQYKWRLFNASAGNEEVSNIKPLIDSGGW